MKAVDMELIKAVLDFYVKVIGTVVVALVGGLAILVPLLFIGEFLVEAPKEFSTVLGSVLLVAVLFRFMFIVGEEK